MKGKVYLVGAGPGDPDLLTLKALRLLKTADAVLYDDLVGPEILQLVSSRALLRNVGKRSRAKKITQAEINSLMISMTRAGMMVIRLKSGDPLIFGRGGEEIEALRNAAIACEVVPGVTAALGAAAAAQIPLTHRHISHALTFISGHEAEQNGSVEWKRVVATGGTLAIYMPGQSYSDVATRLAEAGLRSDTPCGIIAAATRAEQQIEFTTVAQLATVQPLPIPALLIVGEVVRLARLEQTSAEDSLVIAGKANYSSAETLEEIA